MSFAVSAAAIGAATAVGGLAYTISGAGNPSLPPTPNLASSSAAVSKANAALLPIQRGMQAAAQEGKSFTFQLPPGTNPKKYGFDQLPQGTSSAQQTEVFVPGSANLDDPNVKLLAQSLGETPEQLTPKDLQALGPTDTSSKGQWVPYNAADFQQGGKYAALGQPQLRTITNSNGNYTVDFKGYGAADTQGTIAKQNAANQLALAQKYDPQFIAQALKEEQQADPQGTAARALEAQLIQKQMGMDFVNPVSNTLSSQIDQQVNAGKGLDPMESSALNGSVAQALAARGGGSGGADYSAPLTQGMAGIQRQAAGIQKGIGELSSGTTPEDVQYRQSQQNMADLSALISGQTPQSQFKSLSGAQQGPTPQVNGPPLPTSPGNNLAAAGGATLNANATGNQIRNATANPWLSGLSTAISGINAVGNSGAFG